MLVAVASDYFNLAYLVIIAVGVVFTAYKLRPERENLLALQTKTTLEVLSEALDVQTKKVSESQAQIANLTKQVQEDTRQIERLQAQTNLEAVLAALKQQSDALKMIGDGIHKLLQDDNGNGSNAG